MDGRLNLAKFGHKVEKSMLVDRSQIFGEIIGRIVFEVAGIAVARGFGRPGIALTEVAESKGFLKLAEGLEEVTNSAKNIRSQMSNLGEAIPGTSIPKYFRLKTEGPEFFVNPNATKHMGEYINSLPTTHGSPLRNDLIISSFESGVKEAVKSGPGERLWTRGIR